MSQNDPDTLDECALVTVQPMSPAYEKSAAYRDRQREEDAWRLQVYLPAQYRQLVADTAARLGVTNKAAIQYLLDTGATMYNDLTIQNAIDQAPNDRARAAIQAAVDANRDPGIAAAEAAVTAREVMIAGGAAAIEQKARVASSWLAGNLHNQGK